MSVGAMVNKAAGAVASTNATSGAVEAAKAAPTARRTSANTLIAHNRTPMVLTCTTWEKQGRYITLWINPQQTQWSLSRRETVTKTAAGQTRNTWWNRHRKTYYDEWTVNFTFQTGNIMPCAGAIGRDYAASYKAPPIPPGLGDLYEFLQLVNQPMLDGQEENRHVVVYHSRLFPDLRLEGYFVGGTPITFNDTATDGNKTTWSAQFQVYKSYPDIWDYEGLVRAWSEWVQKNAVTEMFSMNSNMQALLAGTLEDKGATKKDNNKSATGAPDTSNSSSPPKPTSPKQKTNETLSTDSKKPGRTIGVVGNYVSGSTGKINTGKPVTDTTSKIKEGKVTADDKSVKKTP